MKNILLLFSILFSLNTFAAGRSNFNTIRLKPITLPAVNASVLGDLVTDTADSKFKFFDGSAWAEFADTTSVQTYSNKIFDNTNDYTALDTKFTLQDNSDNTKQVDFQLSGITTGNTRTFTFPDADTTFVGTGLTQSITDKTFDNSNTFTTLDTLFTLQDDGDNTKQALFQLSGIATGNTRTYTLPDLTTTFAGLDVTQVLSNTTLSTNSSFSLLDTKATFKDDGDATKIFNFDASNITTGTTRTFGVPDADVILLGDTSTQNVTNKTFDITNTFTLLDTLITFQDNVDNTKQWNFNGSNITTGTTRTYGLPNANTTLLGVGSTQNVNNKTIGDSNTITVKDALFKIVDGADVTKIAVFQMAGITTGTTRTYTVPDADTTLVGTGTTQTLSGKTHTDPILNGTLSGTAFLDEDTLVSDSAIAAASQQSIKAYVDASVATGGSGPDSLLNLGTSVAISTDDLVVTLTQKDHTSAPSALNPVAVSFRNATITNGGFGVVLFTATNVITLEAQDTLGVAGAGLLYVYLVSDTADEICLSAKLFDESELQSATALTAGAETSATTLYCTAAHTTKPVRLIGDLKATNSGPNWGSITDVSNQHLDRPALFLSATSSVKTLGTSSDYANMTNNSITLTAGTWKLYGNCIFQTSGSPAYISADCGLFSADGADTSTRPSVVFTGLTVEGGGGTLFNAASSVQTEWSYAVNVNTATLNLITLDTPVLIVTVTVPEEVFVVPAASATAANTRIWTHIIAERMNQ